ncbi:MAG TPA: hypothetical protein VHA73_13960 [Acidimicrobiales bacterium]|jgi:hypothetical protein|nr:hypothetical protein [Acidimicrobiales bacterium]
MDEMAAFTAMKAPTSVVDLRLLQTRIATHLDVLDEQSFDHEFLELDLARSIAALYSTLLEGSEQLDPAQRATLRAGIEYFILTDDDENDVQSPIGMEDDARVANEVCRQLGRPDLVISIP